MEHERDDRLRLENPALKHNASSSKRLVGEDAASNTISARYTVGVPERVVLNN